MQEFIDKYNVKMTYERVSENPYMTGNMKHYSVTIKANNKQITTYYSMGYGLKGNPELSDILECLLMDSSSYSNSNDLLDFASEFEYELETSKQREHVRKVYNACKQANEQFNWIFSFEQLFELYNIES